MKKFLFVFAFLFINIYFGKGQVTPVINNFYLNQYFYNPAFAGSDQRPSLFLNHRLQYYGFEGAPVASALSFHTPLGSSNSSLGLNVFNDRRGLLNHSNAQLTYAYLVPFSSNSGLRFGLSTGVFQNRFNFEGYEDDPLAVKFNEKPFFLDGQFGLNLNIKSFNIGFALPHLFQNNPLNSDGQATTYELNPLNAWNINASMKINVVPNKFSFEPYAVYRKPINDQEFYQVAGLFHINELIYLGASNRQRGGIAGLFGLTIKDLYKVGYSYEMPSQNTPGFTATHELQVTIHLGYKKDRSSKIEVLGEDHHHEHVPRFIVETDDERRDRLIEMEKGFYYVVAATFQYFDEAEKMLIRYKKSGLKEAKIGHNAVSKKYYIWVFHTDSEKKAIKEQKRIIHKHLIKKAKIIKIV
jgi:type IX secretion system PorP/SprF family membrane protein